tara:strand:+ start:219 stop:491 length:273 start_codon:yes stop_codon:yes gene_type:complete
MTATAVRIAATPLSGAIMPKLILSCPACQQKKDLELPAQWKRDQLIAIRCEECRNDFAAHVKSDVRLPERISVDILEFRAPRPSESISCN